VCWRFDEQWPPVLSRAHHSRELAHCGGQELFLRELLGAPDSRDGDGLPVDLEQGAIRTISVFGDLNGRKAMGF
jgi:hypothetical protein